MRYFKAFCKHVNAAPQAVANYREEGNNVVAVVHRGIKGSPKYIIPIADLQAPPEPKPQLDAGIYSVREIRDLELPPEQWAQLLESEKSGKNRDTAIDHIEAQL